MSLLQKLNVLHYTVEKGDNDTPRVDIDGRLYTPQELQRDGITENERKQLKNI